MQCSYSYARKQLSAYPAQEVECSIDAFKKIVVKASAELVTLKKIATSIKPEMKLTCTFDSIH